MKTIRTILATLAGVLLIYGLVAIVSVKQQLAFVERSIFQVFSLSYFVTLVLGVAFLLVAILLTIAVVSFKGGKSVDDEDDDEDEFDDDEEDDEEESDLITSEPRSFAPRRMVAQPRPVAPQSAPVREEEPITRRMPVMRRTHYGDFERPSADTFEIEPRRESQKPAAFCPHCGEVLHEPTQYCPACGKKITRTE